VRSAVAKHGNFRQCESTALQKSHSPVANLQSPFAVHYLPFTIRHSLLAIVLAQQEPCPPNSFRPSSHAPFLSRWLRKRSLLKQAEKLEGASHDAPKFSAVQEHCPPENSSLSTD
jgi:hypothetical protein